MQPAHHSEQMSFLWMRSDPSNMARAAKQFLDDVRSRPATKQHVLISCGRRKQASSAPASDLYISPRFTLSVALVRAVGLNFSVLSAKHGLLASNEIVEPYDLNLASMTRSQRHQWAERTLAQMAIAHPADTTFLLLTEDDYRSDLIPLMEQKKLSYIEPTLGLDRSARVHFLQEANRILAREKAIRALYQAFSDSLEKQPLPTLRDALKIDMPQQGVYFFFDANEPTTFSRSLPRLVRIGTHGVSAGSRATLRDRLRTHFGTLDGLGNHRSSVFRLHVGQALIRKHGLSSQFPTWGSGQNADRNTIEAEREIERQVSDYISSLHVFCLDVSDKATKHSARSKIEKLTIALFTESLIPLEAPSTDWLGLYSAHDVIRRTGLWNVREVGTRADMKLLPALSKRLPVQFSLK